MKINMIDIFTHEPIRVIQGEGKYAGLNTVLIRFGLCNLRCNFCDISMNWTANLKYSINDILQFPNIKNSNLLFTGGEPLLNYHRQVFIQTLIEYIDNKNSIIEIETNGTKKVEIDFLKQRIHFNISPKENRYQLENKIIEKYELLEQLNELNSYIVKFVYDGTIQNESFILNIVEKYNIPNKFVYIMPKGATKEQLQEKLYSTIDFIIKYNFNLSPRLHILLGIAKYLSEPENCK